MYTYYIVVIYLQKKEGLLENWATDMCRLLCNTQQANKLFTFITKHIVGWVDIWQQGVHNKVCWGKAHQLLIINVRVPPPLSEAYSWPGRACIHWKPSLKFWTNVELEADVYQAELGQNNILAITRPMLHDLTNLQQPIALTPICNLTMSYLEIIAREVRKHPAQSSCFLSFCLWYPINTAANMDHPGG